MRRNSEVEKDSIIADAAQNGYGVERGEIRVERPEPSRCFRVAEPLTRRAHRLRVAVEGIHRRPRIQQRRRVAAAAQRAVEDAASACQCRDDFRNENRGVVRTVPRPGSLRHCQSRRYLQNFLTCWSTEGMYFVIVVIICAAACRLDAGASMEIDQRLGPIGGHQFGEITALVLHGVLVGHRADGEPRRAQQELGGVARHQRVSVRQVADRDTEGVRVLVRRSAPVPANSPARARTAGYSARSRRWPPPDGAPRARCRAVRYSRTR